MAITIRARPARSHLQYVFIGATMLAALAAVLPIAAAVISGKSPGSAARTAFATAPSGNYAVVSRPEADFDVIAVVSADGGDPVEIARVPHLRGFTSSGAVSPDGRRLALVTVDGGSLTRPKASLLLVELETAEIRRIGPGMDPLQVPVWASDGLSVVVASAIDDGQAQPTVRFQRVAINGSGSVTLYEVRGALGAYAVGFAPGGGLIGVTIDGSGSHVTLDGKHLSTISTQITRDWRLSPDGMQLAFVEANLESGLRYLARTVSLAGTGARLVEAMSAADGQRLGVAWRPGARVATFGQEPAAAARSSEVGRGENLMAAGFDVPLDYSKDGAALVVSHWSGMSFTEAGEASLEIVTSGGRAEVGDYSRFFGWAAR